MHSQTGFTMGELMTECYFKMPINQLIKIEPQGKSIDGLIRGQLKRDKFYLKINLLLDYIIIKKNIFSPKTC